MGIGIYTGIHVFILNTTHSDLFIVFSPMLIVSNPDMYVLFVLILTDDILHRLHRMLLCV